MKGSKKRKVQGKERETSDEGGSMGERKEEGINTGVGEVNVDLRIIG